MKLKASVFIDLIPSQRDSCPYALAWPRRIVFQWRQSWAPSPRWPRRDCIVLVNLSSWSHSDISLSPSRYFILTDSLWPCIFVWRLGQTAHLASSKKVGRAVPVRSYLNRIMSFVSVKGRKTSSETWTSLPMNALRRNSPKGRKKNWSIFHTFGRFPLNRIIYKFLSLSERIVPYRNRIDFKDDENNSVAQLPDHTT